MTTQKESEASDVLIQTAWCLVMTLKDYRYTKAQIKKALTGRMIDAYFAVEAKRKVE